jgi:PAS domain S-box-containing protein
MEALPRIGGPEVFRLLVDRSPAMSLIMDGQGRLLYANAAFLEATGHSELEAHLIPLADCVQLTAAGGGSLHQRRDLRVTGHFLRTAGPGTAARHVSGIRFDVADPGGEPLTGLVLMDETDLELLRGSAERNRSWYRALFELAPVPMARVDGSGRIDDANPALCHLLGYAPSQLRGRLLSDLTIHCDDPAMCAGWDELLAGRRNRYTVEALIVRKDRRLLSVRVSCWADRAAWGQDTGPGTNGDSSTDARAFCVVYPRVPTRERWVELPPGFQLPAVTALVLEGLAADLSNADIGVRLGLSRQGIDYHLATLRRRLRVSTRGALVARAYALGLLHPGMWPPAVDRQFMEPHPRLPPAVTQHIQRN